MRHHNPTMPRMEKHEEQLEEMHSALYSLSDKARRKPPRSGDKMLPAKLRDKGEHEGTKEARQHIAKLHRAMRGEK